MVTLDDPVTEIAGIGPRYARRLESDLGITTVRDLVEHYPRRYDDLGDVTPLEQARVGEPVTLIGLVTKWSRIPTRGRTTISQAQVRDRAGGGTFTATFFNQAWREKQLPKGTLATFSGTLEHKYGKLQIQMPTFHELAGPGDIAGDGAGDGANVPDTGMWAGDDPDLDHRRRRPVYPGTGSLPSWRLERWIAAALDALPTLSDFLPDATRAAFDLVDLDTAMRDVHQPEDESDSARARRRLIFDELYTLQVGLQWRRARLEAQVVGSDNGPRPDGVADRFLASLPFEPTGAQRRAMLEVGEDLAVDRPMHRLLQGDVGSGKTLVAAWALLCAVDHGRQGALMAPTEVLADQHFRTLQDLLAPLGVNVLDGVRVELLTSSTTTSTRRRVLGELLSGRVDLVVGTHALLEEGVRFADLGVAVIDEQHRFGVHQRVQLREKADEAGARVETPRMPDSLVMTATPIPRSLALTLFGDLDVTVLDELPPGRHEVVTELITPDEEHRRERLYDFVRRQAAEGLQAYVVCPLVEESDEIAARAAEVEYARLCDDVFPDLSVGLVHGRMKGADKDAVMEAFRSGQIDVLVATTVIEVGVDVPTATIMIIEDADRFGISQLHQLRGRVGRGGERSYCVLFAGSSAPELTEEATRRLAAVAATTDGFELAETDLELRGEGQLFGVRQSGLPDLKLARLARDRCLVAQTRDAARELVDEDPELAAPGHRRLSEEVRRRYRGGLEELETLATG